MHWFIFYDLTTPLGLSHYDCQALSTYSSLKIQFHMKDS